MDLDCLVYFRLAIRLRQAVLAHTFAVGGEEWTHVPVDNFEAVKQSLGRLSAAFEAWSQVVELGEMKKHAETILRSCMEAWNRIGQRSSESEVLSPVGSHLRQLEALCQEFVDAQRVNRQEHAAWFDLGQEIVRVERELNSGERNTRSKPAQASNRQQSVPKPTPRAKSKWKWIWKNPKRAERLLQELHVNERLLLPELNLQDAMVDRRLIEQWMTDSPMVGWAHIEAGLQKLADTIPAKPEKRRPCYERDHQFWQWYNDKSSKDTYHSQAGIRDRWNRLHQDKRVTIDVVKQAIKKAKKEAKRKEE